MASNTEKEQAFQQLMKLPKEILVANVSKTLRRYKKECDHLNEELQKHRSQQAHLSEELNTTKENFVRLTEEMGRKDEQITQLSVKRQREAIKAKRLLAEAERTSTEMISKARRTLSKADEEARRRLDNAEQQAENLIQTKMEEAEREIQQLERQREDEKRRTLSVYDGVAGQCDNLINIFTTSLLQLRNAKREIDEKKEEIKREDFRIFDINRYIDDTDYLSEMNDYDGNNLDDLDADVLDELLTGSPASDYDDAPTNTPDVEHNFYNAFAETNVDEADDNVADDGFENLKSFTSSFMKVKTPKDVESDFGLHLLDDLTPTEPPRQSAASRWLN